MMESVPFYVIAVFVLTTLLTIWLFLQSFNKTATRGVSRNVLTFLIPFWLVLTAFMAMSGVYQQSGSLPPRVVTLGVLPALLVIATYFIFFRSEFIERLSLKTLTILHVIRIPVELTLLWLFQAGQVPLIMTFEGRNFDILSGLTAPLAFWLGFRGGRTNRVFLIVWNIFALALLANIVITAIFSFPSPMQRFGFEQPNVGITYFPFIWLATIIVPIVLFAHLAALWKLARGQTS